MSKLNGKLRAELQHTFGKRVSFQKLERKLYGHDIAAVPSLIKPLIGNSIPAAVVQPVTEEELVKLVRWAVQHGVPLTPHGKASSGYGGVIPVKGGLVVDFYRLRAIKHVDRDKKTATVEAGIVWEKLDKELMKQGLTLRLYPSSYPSATVGGWLAQGGAGIGSFEAGWFRDNVVSARVVMPSGEVKEFSGDTLDLVYGAEGITGLISEVTILVQPLEEIETVAIGCPDAHDLQHMVQVIIDKKLPVWSLLFINPRMAELKNKAPLLEHFEHPVEERVLLPASYIITLAFRKKNRNTIMESLPEIMKPCQAEILNDRIAQHEWQNRFKIMLVKRLGPSLVPSEFVVPLSELGNVMAEIEHMVNQPLVKEGLVITKGLNGQPEVVVLGFIPSDQRRFGYNFVFGLALTIMKIAEKHGGRPYSTGLYFASKAKEVMGQGIVTRIKDYKRKTDPGSILNPGKVIDGSAIGAAMNLATAFEPLIRPLGNRVVTHIGERPTKPVRGIPADVAWYAYGCSQCGYCVDECDQFYGRGWESQSPRGKWYWLREYMEGREEWDQFMVDTILVCTTCELCNLRCSASLPIEPAWMKLRGKLINKENRMTIPPFEMMAAAVRKEGDIWAAYRQDRDAWFPEDLKENHGPSHKAEIAYFAGCTASHVETDIAMASVRLLDAAGVDFTYLGKKDNCCGTPMLVCGKWDVFEETMRENVRNMKEAGVTTVVTSCPACDMMWRQVYPRWAEKLGIEFNIEAKHYSEVVAEKIQSGEFVFPESGRKTRVTLHDSCHIARVSSIYDAPRELIKAIPGVELSEMEHNREWAHCCGSVLTLIKDPPVAADIGKARMDEAMETGAEKLIALCPCCEFQFRVTAEKKNLPIETTDLAHFAASALGYDFPDSNPEVQRQWAVFEAMIALMTPEGFAKLMGTMWPELIDAMPFGMGKMMRFMGKIPGALNLMKPMFPILFPRLLPLMMPRLMPVMLNRVEALIPMPDYMREQMPELMPGVMDNLMPHMIGDVVPLLVEPMVDYLRGNEGKRTVK
ncbi:FAD-binding and (Fe-S)-binding domain-containing protein [Chloroflexota bacterium]